MKKKPLVTVNNAHGRSLTDSASDLVTNGLSTLATFNTKEHWISAVCALQFSDLVASGDLFLIFGIV